MRMQIINLLPLDNFTGCDNFYECLKKNYLKQLKEEVCVNLCLKIESKNFGT